MVQRYDHPNVLVTREVQKPSIIGTTSITRFNFYQKCRVKQVRFYPHLAGTSDTFTQTVRTIVGTTTTSVGITTMGTAAPGVAANALSVALGASNSPPGVTLGADDSLSITNAVDGTGAVNLLVEYEVLPDAVRT